MSPSAGSGVLVLAASPPGAGKTTLLSQLAESPGCVFISSEEVRRRFGLNDPFDETQKEQLRSRLLDAIQQAAAADQIIVDSNLLSPESRRAVSSLLPDRRVALIAPFARWESLVDRVRAKFGVGYLYPQGAFSPASVIVHSLDSSHVILQDEAESSYDVILNIDTDHGEWRRWVRDPGGEKLAADLAARLGPYAAPTPLGEMTLLQSRDLWSWNSEVSGLVGRSVVPDTVNHRALVPDTFAKSYLGKLREAWGRGPLIVTSVRVVLVTPKGIVLVRRRDTGEWALPGGSQEIGESITEAAVREVAEEVGVALRDPVLRAVESDPDGSRWDAFGNWNQKVVFCFRAESEIDAFELGGEVVEAGVFPIDRLPPMSARHHTTLVATISERHEVAML